MREHFTRAPFHCRRRGRAAGRSRSGSRAARNLDPDSRRACAIPDAKAGTEHLLYAGPRGRPDHAARAVVLGIASRIEDSCKFATSIRRRPVRRRVVAVCRFKNRVAGLARSAGTDGLVVAAPVQGVAGNAVCEAFSRDNEGARSRRCRAHRRPADGIVLFQAEARRAHTAALRRGEQPLTIHLPLIVPGDCTIRVGSEIHAGRRASCSHSTIASNMRPGIARPRTGWYSSSNHTTRTCDRKNATPSNSRSKNEAAGSGSVEFLLKTIQAWPHKGVDRLAQGRGRRRLLVRGVGSEYRGLRNGRLGI